MSKSLAGTLFVLSAAFFWSSSGFFIKNTHLDPFVITGVRAVVAGLFYAMFLRKRHLKLDKNVRGYIVVYALQSLAFVSATKLTSAANAITLQYTAPFFLFFYSLFSKKEKLSRTNIIPISLVLAGITLFLLEPNTGNSFIGNLLAISSGVLFAFSTYFLRQLRYFDGVALVCLSNLFTALLVSPYLLYKHNIFYSFTPGIWLTFLYLGIVQIGLGVLLYSKGLKLLSALRGSILALTEAILNPLWVFLLLGEKPSVYGFAGGTLVITAVSLDIIFNTPREKAGELYADGSESKELSGFD